MDRRSSDYRGEWDELWRGARLAVVAIAAAVITATGVIAGGAVLVPMVIDDQPTRQDRFITVADR